MPSIKDVTAETYQHAIHTLFCVLFFYARTFSLLPDLPSKDDVVVSTMACSASCSTLWLSNSIFPFSVRQKDRHRHPRWVRERTVIEWHGVGSGGAAVIV